MVAYHKKHGWIIRGVVPSEEDGEIGGKWNYDVKGVLEIANSPGEMRKRFESFVMKNLCMESWDFIMESVSYGNVSERLPSPSLVILLVGVAVVVDVVVVVFAFHYSEPFPILSSYGTPQSDVRGRRAIRGVRRNSRNTRRGPKTQSVVD